MKISDLEAILEEEGEVEEFEEDDDDVPEDDSPIEDRLMESEGNLSEALILMEEIFLTLSAIQERKGKSLTRDLQIEVDNYVALIRDLLTTYDITPGETE